MTIMIMRKKKKKEKYIRPSIALIQDPSHIALTL